MTSKILELNDFLRFDYSDLNGTSGLWETPLSSQLLSKKFLDAACLEYHPAEPSWQGLVGRLDMGRDYEEALRGDLYSSKVCSVLNSLYAEEGYEYYIVGLQKCYQKLLEPSGLTDENTSKLDVQVFSIYEYLAHIYCYVYQKGITDPLAERIEHPAYVGFLGALILQAVVVNSLGKRKRCLASLVAEIIARTLEDDPELKKWATKEVCDGDSGKFSELKNALEDESTGVHFVINTWFITALLHDFGYYPATMWDLLELNYLLSSKEQKRTFLTFEREGAFGVVDRNMIHHALDCAQFIPNNHVFYVTGMLMNEGPRCSDSERRSFYANVQKQYHWFWGCAELCKRLDQLKNDLDCYQRLALGLSARAIYAHHYYHWDSSKIDKYCSEKKVYIPQPLERRLLEIETNNLTQFRREPLAFLLFLLDNCQNFSRKKFLEKEEGKIVNGEEKTYLRLKESDEDISIKLKLEETLIHTNKMKSCNIQKFEKRNVLRISFCGENNKEERMTHLAEWVSNQINIEIENFARLGEDAFLLLVDPGKNYINPLPS